MTVFPKVALGDVVQINPRLLKESRPSDSMPVSFIRMGSICEEGGYIKGAETRSFGEVSKGFSLFSEGDVLFAKITPCMENGKAAIARQLLNGQGAGSTEFFVLRPTAKVLPEFVYYFIRRSSFRASCKANFSGTAGQQRVPRSFLEKTPIPLPPLDEQRRVVDLLDRAAAIRRRADAARAKARAIIPALFLETFGDPATNPKGWPVLRLGAAIDFGPQNGLYRPSTEYGNGVRILRIDSFDHGTIVGQSRLKRLRIDKKTTEKYLLKKGDIVVNRVNSPPQLGKSAVVPVLEEDVVFESNMMRFRLNPEVLVPRVVGVALQLESVRRALTRNAKHAINQSSINQRDVTGIELPIPPIDLQTAYADQVERIETIGRWLDAAAAKAETMAAALAAEVFETRGRGP